MNNNDQQFNDDNFKEDIQPNTPVNHEAEEPYEYVFSNGSTEPQFPQKKVEQGKTRGPKRILRVITVVLCIIMAFGSGFAGALCANSVAKRDEKTTTTGERSPFYEFPEEILTQDPAAPSEKGSAGDEVFSVSQVANAVLDTVVVVNATVTTSSFWGESTGISTGSGVIITASGYIVTCHHVIDQATSITVTLNSGEEYEASLVGSDEASDIALLYVNESKVFPFAGLGNSGDLVLGEYVVAIGNPLGELHRTVTQGVVSGLNRNILTSDGTVMTLLQTDAAVNSGNSGGGLFNLDGELIGIVNAKYAETGVEGLAFAIPVDWANEVLQDLMKYGYVQGIVDHGLTTVDINKDNYYKYASYGIKSYGVYVVESEYCQELKNKDRIISVNGTEVSTTAQMNAIFKSCKVGDVVSILYSRDGNTYTTEMTLQEYVPETIKNRQQK